MKTEKQTTAERQMWIPKSKEEIRKAKEGDLVKVSFASDSLGNVGGLVSKWTLYSGLKEGKDYFYFQKKAQYKEDKDLVVELSSKRDNQQYDRNLGVILNQFYETNFIGPLRQKEKYERKVNELKEAGLWRQ